MILTETSTYHTVQRQVPVDAKSIESMRWDSEFRCTDIRFKGGGGMSVAENPDRIRAMMGGGAETVLRGHKWIEILQDCSCHYGLPAWNEQGGAYFSSAVGEPTGSESRLGSYEAWILHVSKLIEGQGDSHGS